ncbi:hypothetical protein B0H12DRAFT_1112313 [Mycena haematopus]|nr:hypothetical protein B0H12DRAFT_1112313 [Mycena haematopus]
MTPNNEQIWWDLNPPNSLTDQEAFNLQLEATLPRETPYSRVQEWRVGVARAFEQAEALKAASPATCEFHRIYSRIETLQLTHRIYQVGQLMTWLEVVVFQQWTSIYDTLNPPLFVIESTSMFSDSPNALAAGIDGHFFLNLTAESFFSNHYLLDVMKARCEPHFNMFGNRKRVIVERPFEATDERRFEFLGEFVVDIVESSPAAKWFWQQCVPENLKNTSLLHYQSRLASPGPLTNYQIQYHYVKGDFTPLVRLWHYRQTQCYYLAMPFRGGFLDWDREWDLNSDSELQFADDLYFLTN